MAKAEASEQDAAFVPSTTARKRAMIELAERAAPERARRIEANRFYYEDHYRFMRFLVSVRGLYESDESVIRRPLLKS